MNRFGAALSQEPDLDAAIAECVARARAPLGDATPDLALCFVSHEHHAGFAELGARLVEATGASHLLGCTGETVVGGRREVEQGPALSLWLASLPGASLQSFHLSTEVRRGEDGRHEVAVEGMPDLQADTAEDVQARRLSLLLLGEPFSFPAAGWLEQMAAIVPGMPVSGGLASGGSRPGANRLFHRSRSHTAGAVGVAIEGAEVRHVVSQGCRPLGPPMVITRCEENVIQELAGRPPLVQLQAIFDGCDERDREILQHAVSGGGLHIGQVVDELLSQPDQGDFLVRNVMGGDQETGAIQIADHARRGRTVRFHVRDDQSADEDLRQLLAKSAARGPAGGALLFSCNGRGTRLFDVADHDAACIQDGLGDVPLAGFFAQGEIGPVGGRSFLHGFTASVALFPGS